ncbi:hypothetical protein GCM10009795_045450 [Nocardioides hankookensis]|uniref:DUF6461 domain-containing protein n=1 Tax=Nocardioides hankookensis TaxID=443157 RepID=A0ABW1LS32_9ACTN
MRLRASGLITLVLVLSALAASSASAAPAPPDDWHGSKTVMPSAYAWLNDYTPEVDYDLLVIRGLTAGQVRHRLGTVKRRLTDLTPSEAESWVDDHTDDRFYTAPAVAQVARRGPAVIVYVPYWGQSDKTIKKLSRGGLAVHFTTTVELDTYLTVARRGTIVRWFDAGFRPPRNGALPEEEGLDWGARHQNIWATAWAFMERVSRIHISEEWFDLDHPTYVFRGTGP